MALDAAEDVSDHTAVSLQNFATAVDFELQTPEQPTPSIFVGTTDGSFMEVNVDALRQSKTFNKFSEQFERDDLLAESVCYILPPQVKCTNFEKVLHKPEPAERQSYTFDDFEKQFFDIPVDQIYDLINAAEALDIKKLLLYGCQAVGEHLRGKNGDEMRSILGIKAGPKQRAEPKHELIWVDPPEEEGIFLGD